MHLFFAGHDTTAAAISWSIYCLGKYQDEQEIVYTEISELLVDKQEVTWYVNLKFYKVEDSIAIEKTNISLVMN